MRLRKVLRTMFTLQRNSSGHKIILINARFCLCLMTKQRFANVYGGGGGGGGIVLYWVFSTLQIVEVSFKLQSLYPRGASGAIWSRNLIPNLVCMLWRTLYLVAMFVTIKYTSHISLTQRTRANVDVL